MTSNSFFLVPTDKQPAGEDRHEAPFPGAHDASHLRVVEPAPRRPRHNRDAAFCGKTEGLAGKHQ